MLDRPTTRWSRCRLVVRRLGDCELLKKIGSGGMAEVWMGRKGTVGGVSKAVAVKLMAGALAADPRYRRMFLEEARVSMMLTHSNIVQVFDVGQEGDYSYLVMEWVDGLNLAQLGQLLRDANEILPLFVTAHIVGELARALAYAHVVTNEGAPLGVVHRDVSPQNVLISVSGEVKLTDFGVARVAHEDTSGLHVKGKLRYMAPEQLAGRGNAPTVDLYALGAVLHELLDGRKFRHDVDDVQLYAQVIGGVIPPLTSPDIPPELEELRVALLQPDPASRLRSAEDVLATLGRWPGYRNAAPELARVCRRYSGVQAPRSGLFRHVGTGTSAPTWEAMVGPSDAEAGPTQTAATRAWSHEAATPTPSADADATRTSQADAVTLPMSRRLKIPVGRGAALGAGIAACVLAAVGVLVTQQLSVEPTASGEAARLEEESRPKVEPVPPAVVAAPEQPVADGAGEAALEPAPDEEPKGEGNESKLRPAEVLEDGRDDAEGAKRGEGKSTRGERKARRPRALVRFRLDGPRLAYVRVGRGRVFILQPLVDARLSAGRHSLFWRLSKKEPWHDGGVIRLDPDREYRVRVTKSGLEFTED